MIHYDLLKWMGNVSRNLFTYPQQSNTPTIPFNSEQMGQWRRESSGEWRKQSWDGSGWVPTPEYASPTLRGHMDRARDDLMSRATAAQARAEADMQRAFPVLGGLFRGPIYPTVSEQCNRDYNLAVNYTPPKDPLILDLDGDGIEALGINTAAPILFDHDADGVKTATGWIHGDDGLLVLDRNGNGTIDSGLELFGDNTLLAGGGIASDGFEAIAELDENDDGKVDASDSAYASLRVWQDANGDGASQASELKTLSEAGIASIGVEGAPSNIDLGNGNSQPWTGTFTRTSGGTGSTGIAQLSGSLLLASNGFYREFTDDPAPTATANALPQMRAAGWVRDLREAMSLGTADALMLKDLVAEFANATSRTQQQALLDDLISIWAKTSGKLNATGHYLVTDVGFRTAGDVPEGPIEMAPQLSFTVSGMEAQSAEAQTFLTRLWALEAFNGSRFIQMPLPNHAGGNFPPVSSGEGGGGGGGGVAGPPVYTVSFGAQHVGLLEDAWAALAESVYEALVVQTRLKPYLEGIEIAADANGGLAFDFSTTEALLDSRWTSDAGQALDDLVELNRYAESTLVTVGFDALGKLRGWIDELPANSPLRDGLEDLGVLDALNSGGSAYNDIYLGDGAKNSFVGGGGNDAISGGTGNDILMGGDGDDVIEGDAGDDSISGGSHNTFHGWYSGAGNDTFVFGLGDGQDTIYDNDTTTGNFDRLIFGAGINPADVRVQRMGSDAILKLAGTADQVTLHGAFQGDAVSEWTIEQVVFADWTVWDAGTLKAKSLLATEMADNIVGFSDAEVIAGLGGNDSIDGAGGNDTIEGGEGTDILTGGAGDDTLLGGAGDDSIHGGIGDDTIDGGAGNDSVSGELHNTTNAWYAGAGNDTYLFGHGDGQDIVYDNDSTAGNLDRIRFKAGVLPADVQVAREGDRLVLKITGSTDQISVQNFFSDDGSTPWAIEKVEFEDGTFWDLAGIKSRLLTGTSGADNILGFGSADVIAGNDGNDTLDGAGGDDQVDGGNGVDIVFGGAGNDTLLGGAGDDSIQGGTGDDTIDGGAGNDTV